MPNYVRHFFHKVEDVAESWMEAKMSWVEVYGAGRRLKWAGWRWMDLGGDGWNWVEVGARFSNTHIVLQSCKYCISFVIYELHKGSFIETTLGKTIDKRLFFKLFSRHALPIQKTLKQNNSDMEKQSIKDSGWLGALSVKRYIFW